MKSNDYFEPLFLCAANARCLCFITEADIDGLVCTKVKPFPSSPRVSSFGVKGQERGKERGKQQAAHCKAVEQNGQQYCPGEEEQKGTH